MSKLSAEAECFVSNGNNSKTNDRCNSDNAPAAEGSSFPQFHLLNDDIALVILSFVSEAPFESPEMCPRGTLTHVLPLVCHRFHKFTRNLDVLWTESLVRSLTSEDSDTWEAGLLSLVEGHHRNGSDTTTTSSSTKSTNSDDDLSDTCGLEDGGTQRKKHRSSSSPSSMATKKRVANSALTPARNDDQTKPPPISYEAGLIHKACEALRDHPLTKNETMKISIVNVVYQLIVSQHLRLTLPIFYMPSQILLGREIGLHLFEPRYRILIAEVMKGQPAENLNGLPLQLDSRRDFPKFIYANHAPLAPGSPACVVQVRLCRMYSNGTADVMLVPVSHVWLEQVWVRHKSGGLYEGRAILMSRGSSQALEDSVIQSRRYS